MVPFLVLLSLVALTFFIWMLIDAVQRPDTDFKPPGSKVMWVAGLGLSFFFGLGALAAIVYYFVVRKPGMSTTGGRIASGGPRGVRGPRITMKRCPNCNSEIGFYTRFCNHCGSLIPEA